MELVLINLEIGTPFPEELEVLVLLGWLIEKKLDDLRFDYDKTVSRLAKAEAKIRELENAKVETEDRDLKEVAMKPVPQKGWIHCDMVIAPDGFSYVKGPGSM
jgi:hypothetical protein